MPPNNNKAPFFADLKGELKFIGVVSGFILLMFGPSTIEILLRDESERKLPFLNEKNIEIKPNTLDTLTGELDSLPAKNVELRIDTPNVHKSQKSY